MPPVAIEPSPVTAESPDGHIVVTVGPAGDLIELLLDRQVSRLDVRALETAVLAVIRSAQDIAESRLRETSGCTDRDAYPTGVDLAMSPVLSELDRAAAEVRQAREWGGDDRPRPQDFFDHAGFRRYLVELCERMRDVTATGSACGDRIEVITDGTGRLLELRLDELLGRERNVRDLAEGIIGAARDAVRSCRATADDLSDRILAEQAGIGREVAVR